MHHLYTQTADSFATTVTITFEVYQMDDEAVQSILHSCLQEIVRAHSIPMKDANLTSVTSQSLIIDLVIVRVSSGILRVLDIFADELNALTKDEFSLIKLLQSF